MCTLKLLWYSTSHDFYNLVVFMVDGGWCLFSFVPVFVITSCVCVCVCPHVCSDLIGNDTSVGGHNFKVHSFITPHFCDVCGRLLWGLVSQAVKCRGMYVCGSNSTSALFSSLLFSSLLSSPLLSSLSLSLSLSLLFSSFYVSLPPLSPIFS